MARRIERVWFSRGICLLAAAISCSCASFPRVATCPVSPEAPRTREVVISDIDDTIKDTHVRLAKTHAYNPLLVLELVRPSRSVAGMASLYRQKWGDVKKTTVIYVSAGLRSRRLALEGFIQKYGFPKGQIVLRNGGTLIPPHDYKTKAIYPIIKNSPGHHFVLIGDSGEFDPECYGELAREFPNRIDHIYIRQISGEEKYRYQWAFRDIEKKKIDFIPPDTANKAR